ncbi:hypothetical protein M9H77_22182 [Catharanthus roseus]|uniref:Uncharacterized protein n=1 Tax=Catharanthus roseus TaxID=4058 RepID=A0ACC0APS9_CATRO|nr:hypothetical protein M9H77_22182 [Catharanthus roseus]
MATTQSLLMSSLSALAVGHLKESSSPQERRNNISAQAGPSSSTGPPSIAAQPVPRSNNPGGALPFAAQDSFRGPDSTSPAQPRQACRSPNAMPFPRPASVSSLGPPSDAAQLLPQTQLQSLPSGPAPDAAQFLIDSPGLAHSRSSSSAPIPVSSPAYMQSCEQSDYMSRSAPFSPPAPLEHKRGRGGTIRYGDFVYGEFQKKKKSFEGFPKGNKRRENLTFCYLEDFFKETTAKSPGKTKKDWVVYQPGPPGILD